MPKALRITAWSLAAVMLVATLAVMGIIGFAHTDSGRAWIAKLVSRQLSGPQAGDVRLSGLSGSLFGRWHLDRLTVADGDGVWLTVSDLDVGWRPWSLTGMRLAVDQLAAAEVDLVRLPVATVDARAVKATAQPLALPDLRALLPVDVVLSALTVDRMRLGPAVAGVEMRLSVSGALNLDRAGAGEVSLAANRIGDGLDGGGPGDDGPGNEGFGDGDGAGHLRLHARLDPKAEAIDLSLDLREPAGGLVARLAGLPGTPPVTATIDGDGPVDDWRGKIVVTAGDDTSLDGDIQVALAPEMRLSVVADIHAAGVVATLPGLDETARSLLSRPATITATVALPDRGGHTGEIVAIEDFHITNQALDIVAAGELDLVGQGSDATIQVTVLAPDVLQPWIAPADFDAGRFHARLTGTMATPELSFGLEAEQVRVDAADADSPGAARVTLDGSLHFARPSGQPRVLLPVSGKLTLQGVRAGAIAPAGDLIGDGPVIIDFDGTFDFDRARLDPLRVDLVADGIGAGVTGSVDLNQSSATLQGDVAIAEIAPLLASAGLPGQGHAVITFDATSTDMARLWSVQTTAGLDRLVIADALVDTLVGDAADIAGDVRVSLAEGAPVTVEGITLETAAGLAGEGGLRLGRDNHLDAQLTARLEEAAPLGAVLGLEMAGPATADLTFAGPVDNPGLDGTVTVARLGVEPAALVEVVLSGRLADFGNRPQRSFDSSRPGAGWCCRCRDRHLGYR